MSSSATALTGEAILKQLRADRDLLNRYSVRKVALFGSFAAGKQCATSDIDLFVEFEQPTFDNFMGLTRSLETMFQRKVDILTPEGLRSIRIPEIADGIRRSLAYG